MRKAKYIVSLMIFVLGISVLCSGVYAASLLSANIAGNLSVIPAPASLENAIAVRNTDNLSVSIDCSVENGTAVTTPSTTITNNGIWNAGVLTFSTAQFRDQLRLQTVKMKMLVTNNDSVPICVSITGDNAQNTNEIMVTTIGNKYIGVGDTEEISIQFAAEFSRGSNNAITAVTAPTIATYAYNVNITKASTASTLLSRVRYNATGIANRTMNFYIEFGTNPYYSTSTESTQSEKLKWYIWAKDDGNGNPTPLVSGTDYNGSIFLGGGIYYFISEYILDVEDSNMGLSFQAEWQMNSLYTNPEENHASDYAGSNFRNYLNGLTVKRSSLYTGIGTSTVYYNNGSNVNFLDRFKLTEDALYSQILDRSLENLYETGADEGINTFPGAYAGEADKFWALSYSDWSYLITSNNKYDNAIAYKLSSGTSKSASVWWLLSPDGRGCVFTLDDLGYDVCSDVNFSDVGVRPAFQVQI